MKDQWASLVAQLVKNPPAMKETPVLIPGLRISPGEGEDYPLQYSGLENSIERGVAGYSPWGRKESDMTERLSVSLQSMHRCTNEIREKKMSLENRATCFHA